VTAIQGKGLDPDVPVDPQEAAEFGSPAPPDTILQKAVERLAGRIPSCPC
jgi:hypothetical protein